MVVWSSHLSPGGCLVLFHFGLLTSHPGRWLCPCVCVPLLLSWLEDRAVCQAPDSGWLCLLLLAEAFFTSSCLISTGQCISCGGCLPALGCVPMGIGEQIQFCFSWFVCPSVFSLPFVFLGGSRLLATILWQHGGRGKFRSFWACTGHSWNMDIL